MKVNQDLSALKLDYIERRGSWGHSYGIEFMIKDAITGITVVASGRGHHAARQAALDALKVRIEAEPVPNIFRVWYPKSRRYYWRVTPLVKCNNADIMDARRKRWQSAHDYTNTLNQRMQHDETRTESRHTPVCSSLGRKEES